MTRDEKTTTDRDTGLGGLLRNLFFAGVGSAAEARENIRARLDKLVEEGRISAEEAKNILADAGREGEREWDELRAGVKDAVKKVLTDMDVATRSEVDELRGRVETLTAARNDMAARLEKLEQAARDDTAGGGA